jgi:hypothetical protein
MGMVPSAFSRFRILQEHKTLLSEFGSIYAVHAPITCGTLVFINN